MSCARRTFATQRIKAGVEVVYVLAAWDEHAHQCSWQRNTDNIFYHKLIHWPKNRMTTSDTHQHSHIRRMTNDDNIALNVG
jgi:hypothetical protein